MSRAAVLEATGSALPPRVVTNAMLAEGLDTSDEWIRSRTGIRTRHQVDPGTATSDLAVEAGRCALARAAGPVDMLILATTTPDHPCPGTAPEVAARLGLGTVAAFDVSAVCSGFVYALAMAAGAIAAGVAGRVLVIGAETFSLILDPADRTTSVIFGDGAGAFVLRAGQDGEPGMFTGFDLGSDGTLKDLIIVPGGGARERSGGAAGPYFAMRGKDVFANAVTRMADSAAAVLKETGWTAGSVDWFIGHQANSRILYAVAGLLGVDRDRVVLNLDRVGNTSAASIPLAVADALAANRLKPGDRVLMSAFGGGLTWGSTALVWPTTPTR